MSFILGLMETTPNGKRKKSDKLKSLGSVLAEANNDARFMDNNELKYSLRSIEMFAPWINKIFIVTDSSNTKMVKYFSS